MATLIEFIFSLIYVPIVLTIASYLLVKARKIKAGNVVYISVFFYLIAVDYLFVVFEIPHFIYSIYTNTPLILMILFVKSTFYKDKSSYFLVVLAFFIVLRVIDFLLRIGNHFMIPQVVEITKTQVSLYYVFEITVISNSIIVNGWFFYSTVNTYRSIKSASITPWVKKRYLILSYSVLASMINISLSLFIPPEGGWYLGSTLSFGVALLKIPFLMIFLFGNLIGWVMPTRVKEYFNRGYTELNGNDSNEKKLLTIIKELLSSNITS
ncbi:MAG: hypothetical protein ACFFAS_04670 [Promethearchaeota archaeon]